MVCSWVEGEREGERVEGKVDEWRGRWMSGGEGWMSEWRRRMEGKG